MNLLTLVRLSLQVKNDLRVNCKGPIYGEDHLERNKLNIQKRVNEIVFSIVIFRVVLYFSR